MIDASPSVEVRRPAVGAHEAELAALVVVDTALADIRSRDAITRDETFSLLRAVMAAVADAGPSDQVASIVDDLTQTSADAGLIGTPRVADTLLDIRLALAET
jgi:hypothetical protein